MRSGNIYAEGDDGEIVLRSPPSPLSKKSLGLYEAPTDDVGAFTLDRLQICNGDI